MKNLFLMGCIAIACFISSCEKSAVTESITGDVSTDVVAVNNAEAQDLLNSVEDLQEELLESRDNGAGTCPVISSSAPKGTFPNTITIDYGAGCLDKKGRFHSGKIIISQSDSMQHQGAVRKTQFLEFGMDSVRVRNGEIVLTNESTDAEGNKKLIRKTNGMTITGPKGTIEIKSVHVRVQIKGGDTPARQDDVWKIEGESTGTVNGEIKFSSIIKEALIVKGDCPFIVSGKEEVSRNGHTVKIDFGNGNCDRFARGMRENGNEFVIVLRPRFKD